MNQDHFRDLYYHGHKIDRMRRLQYSQPPRARRERLLFYPKHAAYASIRAGPTVAATTYNQLQVFKDGKRKRGERDRLLRII